MNEQRSPEWPTPPAGTDYVHDRDDAVTVTVHLAGTDFSLDDGEWVRVGDEWMRVQAVERRDNSTVLTVRRVAHPPSHAH
jgi:hypothetical protein